MLNGMMAGLSAAGGDFVGALLRPVAQSFGDMAYYALIARFIRNEIDQFGFQMMERVSSTVAAVALILVTIWVFFQGLRMITGQSRESMMALVVNALRITLIVAAATTIGIGGNDMHQFVSEELPSVITRAVTGDESDTAEEQIDENLAAMQFAMSSIDAINIVQDPTLQSDKKQAMMMVAVGTAGPAMVGGAMLLLYQVAMALFIGLGPFFVLCLIFDQTKQFFQRWLMYGISTMFSMAVLSAMIAIATKVVLAVAGAFWVSTTLGALTGLSLNQGMNTIALQQGGVGLLLTVLIISTPPMAANFFNGAVGYFSPSSAVGTAGYRPGQMAGGAPTWSQPSAPSSVGRPGANPGEPGFRGYAPQSLPAYGSAQVNSGMSQAPMQSTYNNPATNPNYGMQPAVQPQGLRGAAANPNQPQQTPPNT
ncbi:MAG: type IV secretion system protein [Pseudomonadota bacterium]